MGDHPCGAGFVTIQISYYYPFFYYSELNLSEFYVFVLQCKPGYAGNGFHCGDDSDSDGVPDRALPCGGISCQAVSLKTHVYLRALCNVTALRPQICLVSL